MSCQPTTLGYYWVQWLELCLLSPLNIVSLLSASCSHLCPDSWLMCTEMLQQFVCPVLFFYTDIIILPLCDGTVVLYPLITFLLCHLCWTGVLPLVSLHSPPCHRASRLTFFLCIPSWRKLLCLFSVNRFACLDTPNTHPLLTVNGLSCPNFCFNFLKCLPPHVCWRVKF